MLQLKQYMKIVSLFTLLFVVISVPAYFMDHQNNQAFNKTSVYSVDAVQLGENDAFQSNNAPSQIISVWERIKRINNSDVVVKSAEYTDLDTDPDLYGTLISALEEHLLLLQSLSALPDLSFADTVRASFSKITYMDVASTTGENINTSTPKSTIDVWEIHAEYQDFHVLAYMDADTSALYDITISSKGSDFIYPSSISEVGFLEYLLEFSDGENKSGDVFSAGGFYLGKMICLYPLSVDKQTGQIVSYRIGGPYDMEPLEYKVSEMTPTEN